MARPLEIDDCIEDMARQLGELYAKVSISRDPMFSWLHITNDATILAEELRRGRDRDREAAERAGKILIRLLEFLGYYLYWHPGKTGKLSDLVAETLRADSYVGEIVGLKEGPSRWILAKYPYSCPKCGQQPCHCMVYPKIIEARREDSQEYLRIFKNKLDEARMKMAGQTHEPFQLKKLFSHFGKIYGNGYYQQDPWKIGMHLIEEIGEATTELSRMNLLWRAKEAEFDIHDALDKTFAISLGRLEVEIVKITDGAVQAARRLQITDDLNKLKAQAKAEPWDVFGRLVGEKFKEEISDVFSWLAAIIVKLDPNQVITKKLLESLSGKPWGEVLVFACKYCHEPQCNNFCLVTHGISAEITEKLSKF